MLGQDKNSFLARVPFKQRQDYLFWLKSSIVLCLGTVLFLAYWSFNSYQAYQQLLTTKYSLLASSSSLDEIVRKKNKLLAWDANQSKHGKHSSGVHARIIDYLRQIENALTLGVQLNSFEYTAKKIEITGYSADIQSLSNTIENLHKLVFIKNHELEQISNSSKDFGSKLAFTIALNL